MGHFDPFPPPWLNGRCPFSYPTSAGASGNGKDAPGGSHSAWSEPPSCWQEAIGD